MQKQITLLFPSESARGNKLNLFGFMAEIDRVIKEQNSIVANIT